MNAEEKDQILAITASRLLRNHSVVFAGVGTPLVTSGLARRLHAPDLTIVLEGGIIGTQLRPGSLPVSTNEMRAAFGCDMLTDITDVFLFAQRGFFDFGILGAAQVDRHGNINTSLIGNRESPIVRLPGSGGANDIISLCKEVIIVTAHERRRFVDSVDFITSPGYLRGGQSRQEAGLVFGGVSWVVTDLAMLDFEPISRTMRLRALQAGVRIEEVIEQTGFELPVADDLITMPAPTESEVEAYRSMTVKSSPGGAI